MYTFHKIINKLNSFFFILSCGAVVRINSRQVKMKHLLPNNYELSSAQGFQRAEEMVLSETPTKWWQ